MKDTNQPDDWRSLCELASEEEDPQKLMELVSKISRALEKRHQRNQKQEASFKVDRVLLQKVIPIATSISTAFRGRVALASQYDC
jgi:hypothetical protein